MSNDNKFAQQQSEAELAGLKNQVEGNLGNNKDKDQDEAAEGIAENLEKTQSKQFPKPEIIMSDKKLNQDADSLEEALDDKQEPDTLAEATTAPLEDETLGRNATEADRPKNK